MMESKRETFRPGDLTFDQLAVLTPRDPDFLNADFLALNQEWRFKEGGKRIVIVCSQGRVRDSGKIQYFAGYESGEYGWIDRDVFAKLRLADYVVLPKVRRAHIKRNLSPHRRLHQPHQLPIRLHRLELRELRLHVVRRAADFSFELAPCTAAKATGISRRMNRIEEGFARMHL
jgi:hypothetical protein